MALHVKLQNKKGKTLEERVAELQGVLINMSVSQDEYVTVGLTIGQINDIVQDGLR